MKKGVLLNIVSADKRLSYNAADKARFDVETTLKRNGYEVVEIPYAKYLGKASAIVKHGYSILKALKKINKIKPEDIIIQYPGFRLGIRAISLLTKLLKSYHVTILIHDIESLRTHGEISQREIDTLSRASEILVHTPAMKDYLVKHGVKVPMKILYLFDYYANGTPQLNKSSHPYSLVFAGNLNKSGFLKKIGKRLYPHKIYLYGLPIEYNWPEGLIYEGKFEPDEVNHIKGDWGLVWDGDSVDTCEGRTGDYLKFNSSHKVSLYLTAGKPVIVWEESAVAPFIKQNNLGICIKSLTDLPEILSNISDKGYQSYLDAVDKIQGKLRNGGMLESCLKS